MFSPEKILENVKSLKKDYDELKGSMDTEDIKRKLMINI